MLNIVEQSGQSPSLIGGLVDVNRWDYLDRLIMQGWHEVKRQMCKCGRPLWQHEHGIHGDKPEAMADYDAYSYSCPAIEAVAAAQGQWAAINKDRIEAYQKSPYGKAKPGEDLIWFAVAPEEPIPSLEHPNGN